jgi:ribosomal protein L23
MITSYDIVQSLIRTEKGSALEPQGKYLFQVALDANSESRGRDL